METNNWKEKFGELKLLGKIVGNNCIDWSIDHQIAIGTNKKLVVCDMSMLISGSKNDDIGFFIETVPVVTEKKDYLKDNPTFMSQFEQACSQTSNTKAAPNSDVYKFFLDPALYIEKYKELKGYKSIKFSYPGCTSAIGTELLAVLSINHSLGVYQKVRAGLHSKWTLLCDFSAMLIDYLEANEQHFPNHSLQFSSEFETFREKKYCSCISSFSWSEVFSFQNENFCFLAASTLNGFVVIWKITLHSKTNLSFIIYDVFCTKWTNISYLTWLRNINCSTFQSKDSVSLVVSNIEGQICCRTKPFLSDDNNSTTWDNCLKKLIWEEEDRLAPRKLEWIDLGDKSLLVASKGHILAAWILSSNLEVLEESLLEDVHCMPIVSLNLFGNDQNLRCITGSSDGVVALIDITLTSNLQVKLNQIIGTQSDIGSFRVVSPALLCGTCLSPNRAFIALLTSRPHVRLSVQVDNEASMFMKRLMSPEQAAEFLLQAISDQSNDTLYKYLDVIELIRQHYATNRKFVPSLESFLAITDIKLEYDIKKLQLRWYLLNAKMKVTKCHRKTLLVDGVIPTLREDEDEECKLVEEVLTIRQMTKLLSAWNRQSNRSDSSVPIVPLLKWLANKEDFLNDVDISMLKSLRSLPALDALPVQQTCSFTSLPAELSSDCKYAICMNGSSWPLCCLTFNLLQGYEKRKCVLSGLFSSIPDLQTSHWLNEILEGPCIFSGSPMRRYIN